MSQQLSLVLVFMVLGIVLIYGAYKKWTWLVDPSIDGWWSMFYTQVVLKRMFGTKGVVLITYCLGIMFVGAGVMYFTRSLWL